MRRPRGLPLLLLPSLAWSAAPQHEFIPPALLHQISAEITVGAAATVEPGEGPLPEAIHEGGRRLTPPEGEAAPARINRDDDVAPDMETDRSDQPQYGAVFRPSIAPMRRDTAYGIFEADERLRLTGGRIPVPVGAPRVDPSRARFWAHLDLKLRRGAPHPLPSVSPDMQILAVESRPEVRLTFERDEDDNFSVSAARGGRFSITLLVDADRAYFGAPVSGNVSLSSGAGHPAAQLPDALAREARGVLEALGVRPDDPFDRGLGRLVAWFRGFEVTATEGEAPERIYRTLALGGKGVCRHRAFAFAITARGAGVPTRVVHNEVHAFVEVLAPDGRWRRIDLGGAPMDLSVVHGGDPAPPFESEDPFPSPPSGDGGGGGAGRAPRRGQIGFGARAEVEIPPLPTVDEVVGVGAPSEQARAVTVTLEAPLRAARQIRGEALGAPLHGRVSDAQTQIPLEGVRVQVFLIADGQPSIALGPAVSTDARGRYRLDAILPKATPLGRYRIVAATNPISGYGGGRSDVD